MSIKSKFLKLSLVSSSLVVSAGAFAADSVLPAGATSAFTQIQEQGLAMIDLAWPPIALITAGFVAIKLFKRGTSKI